MIADDSGDARSEARYEETGTDRETEAAWEWRMFGWCAPEGDDVP
jgi:hypothetical protein